MVVAWHHAFTSWLCLISEELVSMVGIQSDRHHSDQDYISEELVSMVVFYLTCFMGDTFLISEELVSMVGPTTSTSY